MVEYSSEKNFYSYTWCLTLTISRFIYAIQPADDWELVVIILLAFRWVAVKAPQSLNHLVPVKFMYLVGDSREGEISSLQCPTIVIQRPRTHIRYSHRMLRGEVWLDFSWCWMLRSTTTSRRGIRLGWWYLTLETKMIQNLLLSEFMKVHYRMQ